MCSDASIVLCGFGSFLLILACPVAPSTEHAKRRARSKVHQYQTIKLSEDDCYRAPDQGDDGCEEEHSILIQGACDFLGHACVR